MTGQDTTLDTQLDAVICGHMNAPYQEILTEDALEFLVRLHHQFYERRNELLENRRERQAQFDNGVLPDFLPNTRHIRDGEWTIAPVPSEIADRRVEITGPVDRKMIINGLNSGAKVFMADFEDSNSPLWMNNIEGQLNLRDAVNGTISYTDPETQKEYNLSDELAVLFVRPRGLHLEEHGLEIAGKPAVAALVDFGLYCFHNAQELLKKGSRPYFYLPKLESHLEAQLWNDLFVFTQQFLDIDPGTFKATVLIETLPAVFEMDEILFALKDHSAGLNCGRWDYIFSYIKTFRNNFRKSLPNRDQVSMTTPCMSAYSDLLIQTCHHRGAHAIGGMAAQIPIKNDDFANKAAIDKVKLDKLHEVINGHDGTWVAHPALVPVAMDIFDQYMPGANQMNNLRHDVVISARNLLQTPTGTITLDGIRTNINVGVLYLESWLRGHGAVGLYNLMEDTATAEISRSQIWQWIQHECYTVGGILITPKLYQDLKNEELEKIRERIGEETFYEGRFKEAAALFDELVLSPEMKDFMTIPACALLNQ